MAEKRDPREITTEEQAIQDILKRRQERKVRRGKPSRAKQVLLIILLLIAAFAFSRSTLFTVDSIEVEGNSYFTDEEIINMAHASTGRNIFYNLGKGSMIDFLEANPYIKDARIYRKLPSTISIHVEERPQIAAIVYDDEFLIIDKEGILLRKTTTEPKITIVSGFKVSKMEIGEPLEVSDSRTLENMLSLMESMEKNDLYFIRIEMSDLYIKMYIYDTLVVKGKYDELKSTMDKGRLSKIVAELFERNIKRGTITITSAGYASFTPGVA